MIQSTFTERIFRKFFPDYQHRWEIYEQILINNITKDIVWLDIGCGRNEFVERFGGEAKQALGIDLLDEEERTAAPFLKTDLRHIPLPDGCAHLITMRMVVEHLERIPQDFSELRRLLVPGGILIILTTNSLSPVIFFPRLLPFRLKSWIIQKTFGVRSKEIFPTFHRFNTPMKMKKGFYDMALLDLYYIEQVPLDKPFLTFIFGLWYACVMPISMRYYRRNLLAIFRKEKK